MYEVDDAVPLTPAASINIDVSVGRIYTLRPNQNTTLTATNIVPGGIVAIGIRTQGTTSFNVTFGSGFTSAPVLATGTVTNVNMLKLFWAHGNNLFDIKALLV